MPSQDRQVSFRRTAAVYATGVGVASSLLDGVPLAMTVNSFATVSLAPMLVSTCLTHQCRLLPAVRYSGMFAVTVLAADQEATARWFADARRPSGAPAFAGVPVHRAPATGCLLLSDGMAYFDCQVRDVFDQGDHAVVVGEAVAFGTLNAAKEPLLYYRGRYRSLKAAPDPDPPLAVSVIDGVDAGNGSVVPAT